MDIVIYTQRVEMVKEYGEKRDCADQRIAKFIYACGYLPVAIPNQPELALEYINNLCPAGIILTGGNSLVKYGGDAIERDLMDNALIRAAVEKRIPLFGICRGMQSILDYFGNILNTVEGHVAIRHPVSDGREFFEVNSYHKMACNSLQPNCGLRAIKLAPDRVIEQIEHERLPISAVMWHPEREITFCDKDIKIVRGLFRLGDKTYESNNIGGR